LENAAREVECLGSGKDMSVAFEIPGDTGDEAAAVLNLNFSDGLRSNIKTLLWSAISPVLRRNTGKQMSNVVNTLS